MDATISRSDGLIFSLVEIGKLFGKSRWTIRRWIDREGFPACKLPDGHWVTDRELIRRWMLSGRLWPSVDYTNSSGIVRRAA